MERLEQLLGQLISSSKRRGDEFERLCKWFLENDPIYATQLDKVWLWEEWPDRWGPDAGIDLVARTRQGELWAIQAKHYAPASTVSKADIDSFLSESSRPGFAFRLLIATTDRLSANAKRTLDGQKVPAQALLRSQLVERELVWPDRIGQEPKRREPHTPRDHQKAAIKDVAKGFAQADRGQMIMACGTGKTLTSLFIAEKLAAKRVLVLVPSLSLLSQTLSEWTANAKNPIEFLPVCSDATVAEKDAAVESTSELGFPVTTDPGEIATFVRRRGDTMRVVFATYQSSDRIEAAQKLSRVPKFDLVIADEAHRCTGNTTSDFATVLDADKIRSDRRLFMTATPRILSARVQRSALDEGLKFASMDDENTFGPVFHRLTFATAIEQDLLADYQVVILGVDNEEVLKAVQERQLVTTDGKNIISADRLGAAVGLAKAIRKYGLTRLITFHGRVKAASDFADTFPAILHWMPARQRPKGTTETNFVSGEMSAGERKRAIHHLKSSEADQVILANARVLTEGIDVPDLDGIAFMDPRNSEVDIVQAVGRAIRKPRGKNKDKIGTIVLPIVIEQTKDTDAELDRTNYKAIWAVLRALRAHDERLAEDVDVLRQGLGRTGSIRESDMPARIILDLPRNAGAEFAQALSTRLVESSTSSWEEWFGRLTGFSERYGHARLDRSVSFDGYMLGRWVGKQRSRRSALLPDRVSRLEALSGWTWDVYDALWTAGINALTDYTKQFGNANPAASFRTEGGFRLGKWCAYQRVQWRSSRLASSQILALESLPGWSWNPDVDRWNRGFARLEEYVLLHGHARPSALHVTDDGFRLGSWVNGQRSGSTVKGGVRLHGRARLSVNQQQRLEQLPGWTWNVYHETWEAHFEVLRDCVKAIGTTALTKSFRHGKFHLGSWVSSQRANRTDLDDVQIKRLELLPGWTWDPRRDRWIQGFLALQEFLDKYGHARPAQTYVSEAGFELGSWVARQRRRREILSSEDQSALEELRGWVWHSFDATWEEGYLALRGFCAEFGHAAPPASYIDNDGFRLGAWVSRQRGSRASISTDRSTRLEGIPGWIWEVRSPRKQWH